MKNNRYLPNLSVLFFLLTLVLALFSWVGNAYGMGEIQSLLSAEGIRWMLGYVVKNYVQTPALGIVLVLMMGLGIVVRSGLYGVLCRVLQREKHLSRKERRALVLALVVFFVYALCVVLTLLLPWNFLLGVTGSWLHSPFSRGFVYILSLGIGLSGTVYGYVSDAFRRLSDVADGMAMLLSYAAPFFVTLFFVSQFFASLEYTRVLEWMRMDAGVMEIVYTLLCFLPLLAMKK